LVWFGLLFGGVLQLFLNFLSNWRSPTAGNNKARGKQKSGYGEKGNVGITLQNMSSLIIYSRDFTIFGQDAC